MTRYSDCSAEIRKAPLTWTVTGAAGFIGSALVETLLDLGQTVIGVDNFATGHKKNLDEVLATAGTARQRFTFIEGDICDPEVCRRACAGSSRVLHQAALGSVPRSIAQPLASHQANVDGFVHMLMAARDARARFVYASSSSVYGDDATLPKVEGREGDPLSPYAATKQIDEIYALVFQRTYGIETIGLRYFNVFGRRQDPNGPYAAVIPRWLDNLFSDKPCEMFGDGENSRDFCYIDNAVQANILAALAPASATARVYNIGFGGRTTLKTLFQLLRDGVAVHHPSAKNSQPTMVPPRPGDVAHSQASIEQARKELGFEPSHDIGRGLVATIEWYAKQRGITG